MGLRAGGAALFAHADFDAAGLEIAGAVIQRLGASPWRFGVADYARGVAANDRPNAVLPSSLPATPWDAALAQAMRSGRRVEEEEVLDVLLSDLGISATMRP